MKVLAVIPARYASTRLPGKPLLKIRNKPMIQWVYERTSQARGLSQVFVATDDDRIVEVVRGFGGNVLMTGGEIESGTDRVAAIADKIPADIYVNVQGDEPLIEPLAIEKVAALVGSGRFPMTTVTVPLTTKADLRSLTIVKAITDKTNRVLYFSRYPIPYSRKAGPDPGSPFVCRKHVGLYAYTREALFRMRALRPSPLEQAESLEQLRALEDGIPIGAVEMDFNSIGVDVLEDLEKVEKIL